MKIFGVFKLNGIESEEQFEQLETKELFIDDLQLMIPETEEGYLLSLQFLSGIFEEDIKMYSAVIDAPDVPELLETGHVKAYKAAFGEFKEVEMTDLYFCTEDSWEVTEYNIEEAVNVIE